MATHTFSTDINPALYVESAAVDVLSGATPVKVSPRPAVGTVVKVRNAVTLANLADTATTNNNGFMSFTTTDVPSVLISVNAWATSIGPFWSKEASRTGLYAADNGVKGDGTTDDAAALNTLMTAAAALGTPVTLTPASTVIVNAAALAPPSGTVLNLNGATIKSARPGSTDRLLTLSGVTNVLIFGGTFDGDKASYAPATEQRHNIHVINSSKVTLRDLTSKNAKGDGVYIGDDVSGLSTDVRLDRVTCDLNHRQGMSVSAVSGLTVTASKFSNTSGTAPQSGVDIEANTDTAIIERVRFVGCDMTGNTNAGVIVSCRVAPSVRQEGIDFVGCDMNGNLSDGVLLVAGRRIRFIGGEIAGNTNRGVWFSAAAPGMDDVTFEGTAITKNGRQGVLADSPFNRLSMTGCTVIDNCQTTTGIGIDLNPTSASVGARIVGCVSGNTGGGATQTHGLRTTANVSSLAAAGNSYPANATAMVSLGDDITTRVRADASGSDTPTVTAFVAKSTWTAAGGSTILGLRTTGDTVDRVAGRTDGVLTFSSGAAAQDTQLSRLAVGVLGVGADDCLRTGKNVTGSRPSASTAGSGSQFYDTTLSQPIWSDGTVWKDATGTTV